MPDFSCRYRRPSFFLVFVATLFLGGLEFAAGADDGGALALPDMVVSAARQPVPAGQLPYATAVVVADTELALGRLQPAMPELLAGQPGVMLQKTANGMTSPYIRGFTGFRNLLLVDGFRFNNSTLRDGPNQYWSLVDAYALDRLELVRGPGAALYGSDAVGGLVNAVSRSGLNLAANTWEGRVFSRFSSAGGGLSGRLGVSGNVDGRLGVSAGISELTNRDLQGGRDIGKQEKTGFDGVSGDLKLDFLLAPDQLLTLAHQQSRQDDVWRTHRTIYGNVWHGATPGTDRRNSFDHERELSYLKYRLTDGDGWLSSLEAGICRQLLKEDELRIRANGRRQLQGFDVETFGAFATLETPTPAGVFTYGFDWYHDRVWSSRRDYNAAGVLTAIAVQGPVADDARYDLAGVFVQDRIKISDRTELTLGTRFTYANARAGRVQDPVTGLRIRVSDSWSATASQARLLVALDAERRLHWFAAAAQSFRAPNLSDLTRYDTARTAEIETPAPGLDPEHYLTLETGLRLQLERVGAELTVFRTDIRDMIVRTPTGLLIGGLNEVTKRNAGDGRVHGVELAGKWQCLPTVRLEAGAAWLTGEVDGYPTAAPVQQREYISRIMPPTVTAGVVWEPEADARRWTFGANVTAVGNQDKLSVSDRADTQRIPPGGTPGYTVVNLRVGCRLTDKVRLAMVLENVFDRDYRIHGSGSNEPGRGFTLSLDARF